jgi:uncharacterized protein
MNNLRNVWRVLGFAVALTLGACHSATTRIYGLDPTSPTARVDGYQAPALRVDAISIPASWDRIEILDLSAAGHLEISDFDHWSAPLAQLIRQTLSDDLEQRLPAGKVIYPRLPKPAGALGVSVDILEFTVAGSQTTMRAGWLITPAAGSQSGRREATVLHASLSSREPAAIAHAWSELIGLLADRIAADAASLNAR